MSNNKQLDMSYDDSRIFNEEGVSVKLKNKPGYDSIPIKEHAQTKLR